MFANHCHQISFEDDMNGFSSFDWSRSSLLLIVISLAECEKALNTLAGDNGQHSWKRLSN